MKIRFGILGPGTIAGRLMRDFHVARDAQLMAVASREMARAEAFAQQWDIPIVLDSYEALCENPQVDVVYIATPHPFHKEQALLAMRSGKHVLVEKPASLNAASFEEMSACAAENGVLLMEGMWTRFFPATLRIHELLRAGEIGELRALEAHFSFYQKEDGRSRLFDPALGGGALLDLGCYLVSYALDMFGAPPVEVDGHARIGGTGVDTLDLIHLRFEQGIASLLCGLDASVQPEATLMGTEGSIYVPDFYHPRRIHLRRTGEVERVMAYPYQEEGFAYEIQHVCECVRRGMQQSTLMPWRDSLSTLQVMDQLREKWGLRYPQEAR